MTLKEYVEDRKKRWIGLKVYYRGKPYTVVDVDHNGMLLIDRPNAFIDTNGRMSEITDTTAVTEAQLD